MIKNQDLDHFRGQYPYGSELFGVYQTLLGWRGRRARSWFMRGYARERRELRDSIFRRLLAAVDARPNADHVLARIGHIGIGEIGAHTRGGSRLLQSLAARLPASARTGDAAFWRAALSDDVLNRALDTNVRKVAEEMLTAPTGASSAAGSRRGDALHEELNPAAARTLQVLRFLDHESRVAGELKLLRDNGATAELRRMMSTRSLQHDMISAAARTMAAEDVFAHLEPMGIVGRTALSPVGIIHLFRQYFFELDSFLGSPCGHVWVAPGTTVELVEINSRRTLTEMTIDESALSRVEQFGESFILEDLHEAVSRSNQQDLSFGASVSGSHSWIVGSVQASASMSYHQTQSESRFAARDLMRRKTEHISSLMEKSVRTTFRTVTEKSEISSKRYVLSNPTEDLVNYELRRKMRRVAVQVQDAGTYLSWQAFVDDPGRELGVANLVHIAEPPNLSAIPHPQRIEPKPSQTTHETVMIPYQPITADDGDKDDETWDEGEESSWSSAFDRIETIAWIFPQRFRSPDPDYRLTSVKATPLGDARIGLQPKEAKDFVEKDGYFEFKLLLEHAHFHGSPAIGVELELLWESREDRDKIEKENASRLATFIAQQRRAYEEAYVKAARERIDTASRIAPRRYEDLRQEERIAVFRRLLRSLAPGQPSEDDEMTLAARHFSYPEMTDSTRHAWSEILNRMFDLEKMLYFVAPEWWKPRPHTPQAFGSEEPVLDEDGNVVRDANGNMVMQSVTATPIPDRSIVSWGGGREAGRSNYYITENSAPAHLGSSLGWLLQLDGDSMRNAFLNAPWVKAIVPIRPGAEADAIAWLKGVAEGDAGLTSALEAQLRELAAKVADKHKKATTVQTIPDLIDPNQTVSSTPIDRVFEFGFDPLQGGFRAQSLDGHEFEIIDQWVEVVPTDQVAATEVRYDPATGRQLPPV